MVVKKDIAVVGAGTGGYVAALRAAQLKKNVVLFERDAVGGTCMNYGCIPTKHLLHQTKLFKDVRTSKGLAGPTGAVVCDWPNVLREKAKVVGRLVRGVEFLLQRNGVEVVKAEARVRDDRHIAVRTNSGEKTYEADRIILATGSRAAELPFLKVDRTTVITSTEALEFQNVPKSMLVVGAGAIGIEMGTIYSRLGTEVTVLEIMPTVLPGCDQEMSVRLERLLKGQGLRIFTEMRIEHYVNADGRGVLTGTCLKDAKPFSFEADVVLLAAGRKANSDSFSDVPALIRTNPAGWIEVNDRLETNVPGIYAIGDVVGGKLLAHKASHDGLAAAANAAGGRAIVDYHALPMAVFTDPEFAAVGLTEEEARRHTDRVRVGVFSFQANGRAVTMDSPEGQVKIIAGRDDRILGAHILGPSASDLIAELTLAMRNKLTIGDVAATVHVHPTLSEAVMEAALKVHGQAIHMMN